MKTKYNIAAAVIDTYEKLKRLSSTKYKYKWTLEISERQPKKTKRKRKLK